MSRLGLFNKLIWIVEDNPEMLRLYETLFGFKYRIKYFEGLSSFYKGIDFLFSDKQHRPTLIISGLIFKDGNLLNKLTEIISKSHKQEISLPFFFVTEIDDIDVIRYCLKNGAIDLLTKPFNKNELLVKVGNVLSGLALNKGLIDIADKFITLDGIKISNLTSKQIQVLSLFIESPDWSANRQKILTKVWGDTTVHPKTVDVHLYNLRKKLDQHGFLIRSDGGGNWSLVHDVRCH
jgi:DNA-binding response OmpR family regulator